MTRLQTEQRRLQYRGREFHFVSFEGRPADPRRGQAAMGPAWWLMSAGTRWEVMAFHPGQDAGDLDRALTAWLEAHVFRPMQETGG